MNKPPVLLPLLLPFFLYSTASASPAELGAPTRVAGFTAEPVQEGSEPFFFPVPQQGEVCRTAYFRANDGVHGVELWRTDGTPAGTLLVRDLCPGPCDSWPVPRAQIGGLLLFDTRPEAGSRIEGGLWVTDGSYRGTRRLLRGPVGEWVVYEGELWFFRDGELWRSDGTPAGTTSAVEVCGAGCEAGPFGMTVAGDLLYFTLHESTVGSELWASDGTAGGTGRVADICPGRCDSFPAHLTAYGDGLVFEATDGVHGREPWVSDGTAGGTRMVRDLEPGPADGGARGLSPFDGAVYFITDRANPDAAPEVWRTDGTEAGTEPVPTVLPQGAQPVRLGPVLPGEDRLLIVATNDDGTALYGYDRTTGLWRELVVGKDSYGVTEGGSLGRRLVFIVASHEELGQRRLVELWATDGTPEGTGLLRKLDSGGALVQPTAVLPVADGQTVVFSAPDGLGSHEPWLSDGTAAGTGLLKELRPARTNGDPREVTHFGRWVYFVADSHQGSGVLWRSATADGPLELVDRGRPWGRLVAAGSHLFAVSADRSVVALVDGETATVEILAELPRLVNEPTTVGERLFFGTEGGGQELWVSDGTPEGTRLVVDLDPSWDDVCGWPTPTGCPEEVVFPSNLAAAGETLFFFAWPNPSAEAPTPGLWRSDGTAEGTLALTDVDLSPRGAQAVGDRLVLSLHVLDGGSPELWVSDGTPEGTGPLLPMEGGALEGAPLAAGDDLLFLEVPREDRTSALWATDGTAAGTYEVSALEVGGLRVTSVGETTVVGDRLFFAAGHPLLGDELWVSDGTAAGTGRVANLAVGEEGSLPADLTPFEGGVLFAAAGDAAGYELWESDGTRAGTRRLTDLRPGPGASNPSEITVTPEAVFFVAEAGDGGPELWRAPVAEASPPGGSVPSPPQWEPMVSDRLPGFRVWVRISAGGSSRRGEQEAACIPETLCVSGAVPGRSELFVRVVGPKGNGRLWPTLVRFTTSTVEVWVEQVASGDQRYYLLEGATPGSSDLSGLFDRAGFEP